MESVEIIQYVFAGITLLAIIGVLCYGFIKAISKQSKLYDLNFKKITLEIKKLERDLGYEEADK